MTGVFAAWQPRYAEHGIPTFPVDLSTKKPEVVVSRRWWKLAWRGSGTAWWSGSGGEVKVDG
jgi:alkylation response protein AidB-like acyl-CoA dehydrogenase